MNARRMIVMLAGAGVLFGGVIGFVKFREHMIQQYFATMPKPVFVVTAEPATVEHWQETVPAVGTLRAVNGVDISASVAGLVREIAFESGQPVRKGHVLLRLDAEVERSNLRSAQADADLARISAERQRTLVRTDTVSRAALDKAEAELKVREAAVAGYKAVIDKKTVQAPFDGIVGVRKVDLGQYLQPGQAIVSLQDLSVLLADFTVSQRDLGALKPDEPIRLTTDSWPGRVFEGTISAVEPRVDAATGMIAAQARFPNPDGALRPGMFARVEVVRAAVAEVVTVPVSAVSYNLHGDAVFLVRDGEGDARTAERAVVALGERREGRVAILSGVKAGDLVVTAGQLKLENGSRIEMAETDPLKQASAR
ncbi:efflux RND transporter periplasmic adaptor subunit [Magnetospirillum sp. UT-4]|uniref:efflux RND transporter periplasmic adaptor subunit n=1 Tax=Magnetospirillum sp. UT-4 TaxID=2681467 RepID=UPI001382F1EE|nr:efflux RND transporter periplasmic adaptor subunit [Magnetospirillum sp. UT-4]CAA7623901.1 Membrane-fusion protein [Magnetospirillum sp. UT-4]